MKQVERLMVVLVLVALVLPIAGQSLPRTSSGVSLEKLSGPAGIIFTGTVLRIERAKDSDPAFVRVTFRVDTAVRGCIAGQTIAVDQWAELWEKSDRYRKGQQVLLFLYPPSETGLTSPVAGDLGQIKLGPQGLLLTPQQARFLSSQNSAMSSQSDVPHLDGNPPASRNVGLRNQRPLRYDAE